MNNDTTFEGGQQQCVLLGYFFSNDYNIPIFLPIAENKARSHKSEIGN